MQARTEEVLAFLDTKRADLQQVVEGVPETLRGRRPAPDRWSVAEILEHLTLVEGRIKKLLSTHVAAAREAGLGAEHETAPVVPTVNVAQMENRSEPIVAREGSLPQGSVEARAAWDALEAQRRGVRDFVLGADGLALSDVIIPHPRFGQLNVYQWLVFLGAHEARHTAQIRETAADLSA